MGILKVLELGMTWANKAGKWWGKRKKRKHETSTDKIVDSHDTDAINKRVLNINKKRKARRDES